MGFLNAGVGNAIGQGYGLANSTGLTQILTGDPTRVQFLRDGVGTIFTADAILNESHQREAAPTQFPLEDGGVISDHIIVAPIEVTLTGVVCDYPLHDPRKIISQALGAAVSGLLPPLAVTIGAGAQKLYSLTHSPILPSKAAYETLIELQAGKPNASPPTLPEPFTVITHYARYTDMVIKSLQFNVDATTASMCVFTATLTQLRRVKPQAVNISLLAAPGLAAQKLESGDKEGLLSDTLRGAADADKVADFVGDKADRGVAAIKSGLHLLPGVGG